MRTSWIATFVCVSAMSAFPALGLAQFTETEKGTGAGALLGAGTGAIIGGVGGYAVGHEAQGQQTIKDENRRAVYS